MARGTYDDATDRRLRLLVGLVVSLAAPAVVLAAVATVTDNVPQRNSLATIGALVFLIAVARLAVVNVRIRSNRHGTAWTDAAILIGLAVAPASWVVLCTAIGSAVASSILRVSPEKAFFGIAKSVLVAATGALVVISLGATAHPGHPLDHVGALIIAYLAMNVVDEVLSIPIIAIASRTKIRVRFAAHPDIRIASFVARFAVSAIALALLEADGRLVVAVPPIVLCLHLWYSNRLRSVAEREAWQRLAEATDALNDVSLDHVLRAATRSAAALFSADEVEVEIWLEGRRRLVRGDGLDILYDGQPDHAPVDATRVMAVSLEGYEGADDIGVLRLRFRASVTLSERELYTLKTFASALCTAIRNASAYAELERAAEEHAHAAAHDSLTGLPNRRRLLDHGADLLGRRHADGVIALLLIDLNHFKEVNDTLGHAAGDQVLIAVADRLRAVVGPGDLVARLGGDEFAVLYAGLPAPAIAAHRAELALTGLNEPIEIDGMRISVEASGGIAVAPGAGGVVELLRRADVAMYQAKRTGQPIAVYARARDTADVGRLALGGDLPRAVAEHEFTVNFQPIVDLASGEVIAAEALARWHHPDRGDLDPRRFLDAVERSGLLPAFADAVLEQALVAAVTWRDAGFDLPVAVNVSPRSLLDPRFPSSVAARLRAHNLPADRLFLELTETLTISQLEVVDRVLGQLRDEGVRLALDDFGTGYSSLSVLSRVPVNELKIDRAFIGAMESSAEAAAVVRSTVELARSLDLVVVAEGVESEPQRRTLWELGCGAGQGHLFARPMPQTRLLAALHRGTGGRPGAFAPALHEDGAVVRIPKRRMVGRSREERLPDLPA
ncbi:MAG TPA: bifunctional diguanylate cyclase/phosphodiesterase [Micromonosporaceae bacterium]